MGNRGAAGLMKYSFRSSGLRISLAAAVSLVLAGGDLVASESSRVRTVEQLQAALKRGDLRPLVLIKGNEARLYFTNADQQVMF